MFKIQTLFIVTAFLISVCNYLYLGATVDIQLNDTYYVITEKFVAESIALVCILHYVVYAGFARYNKPLSVKLGLIHYVLTVLPVPLLLLNPVGDIRMVTLWAMTVLLCFAAGQVMLLINIYRSVKLSADHNHENNT